MKLSLPNPPSNYDATDQVQTRRAITGALVNMVETGKDYRPAGGRIILSSPSGDEWVLTVADDGTLTAEAL